MSNDKDAALRPARSVSRRPDLRVGLLPLPDFTLLAFAGFLDTLRLAADEGDRSHQIRCAWTVMSEDRQPVRASNGVSIQPSHGLLAPTDFDYLVVIGGTLHAGPRETPSLLRYLDQAAQDNVPLVGLCTGAFTLARAGLMGGRRACVSWFHHDDYAAEFPELEVVSDRLFLDDNDRITSAGGVSVVHLASHFVERHLGEGAAAKGLRIMIENAARAGRDPQPAPATSGTAAGSDPRVRRALLAMERRLSASLGLDDIARLAGSTPRHLSRLFQAELGLTPMRALLELRLKRSRRLIEEGRSLAEVAAECGFSDAAHFTRRFRRHYGLTPGAAKREHFQVARNMSAG